MGRITETHDAVVIVAMVYPNTWVKKRKNTKYLGKNSKYREKQQKLQIYTG